ncbi:lantibiotic dehydratase [uncultured Arcticibacterium sp.]|uniref:lantibiotic dehydratase n=1 Tax=uncultured Arcticibacterium sp. TaxID=2173042 RepID=UPI0030F6DAD4
MSKYTFLPELVLRTPAKPFRSQLTELEIITLLKNQGFLETVFLASPSLYQAILDFNTGTLSEKSQKGVLRSAAKYIIRSHARSTPFGLFAGTSTLKWGDKTRIVIGNSVQRRTQLDFGFINDLYKGISESPEFISQVKYFPNSSYYILHDEIRYLEKTFENDQVTFQISALEKNDFLLFLLEKTENGLSLNQLTKVLKEEGVDEQDALDFLASLIDCQILVNKAEPSLNSPDKLGDLITLHRKLDTNKSHELTSIKEKLNQLDACKQNNIKKYDISANALNQKTFHTECFFNLKINSSLDQNLQKEILEALAVINTLQERTENNRLNEFKARFKRRFGSQEVALPIALDTEKGLGYDQEFDIAPAPLIENLNFVPFQNLTLSNTDKKKETFLDNLLEKAIKRNQYEVKLEDENLPELNYDLNLSASCSVLFRLISENKLYLEAAGGSSAINLICRFANSSEALGNLVDKISKEERKNNPSVRFAEIIHLPNSKLGNVLSRRSVFKHEISFWGVGKAQETIALKDLAILIQEEKLFLKNLKTNEIIIPKLNCTHNVGEADLPVYKFLYDLQFQGLDGSIKLNWNQQQSFYPRVSYKGIVLSLATWKFQHSPLSEIHKLKSINDFNEWHKKLKMPQLFVISEGDNDLLINSESEFLIKLFMNSVKNKKSLTLKEFLFDKNQAVKNFEGEPMLNQFIGSLIKSGETYAVPQNETLDEATSTKTLNSKESLIEHNWLYIKLYAPLSTFDSILSNQISEVLKTAFDRNLIDKWFFIRLRDPDLHLRIRFHLKDIEKGQELVSLLNQYLSNHKDIWKLEFGKYERELERYAAIGIENAESIFHEESSSYVHFITKNENEELRWLYGLKCIDNLLNYCEYNLANKLRFITTLRNGFAEEFGVNQEKKKELDKLYREQRQKVNNTLSQISRFKPVMPFEEDWTKKAGFEKSALAGLTHMCINRIMKTQPRLHELVIYDFLMRSYKSILAQQKK